MQEVGAPHNREEAVVHNVVLLIVWGAVGFVVAARQFPWVPQGVGA